MIFVASKTVLEREGRGPPPMKKGHAKAVGDALDTNRGMPFLGRAKV